MGRATGCLLLALMALSPAMMLALPFAWGEADAPPPMELSVPLPIELRIGMYVNFNITVINHENWSKGPMDVRVYDWPALIYETTTSVQAKSEQKVPVQFTVTGEEEAVHDYKVVVGNIEVSGSRWVGREGTPPIIYISSFNIYPAFVDHAVPDRAHNFTMTVDLNNTGTLDGEVLLTVMADGGVVASRFVTVQGNTSARLQTNWPVRGEGLHRATAMISGVPAAGQQPVTADCALYYSEAESAGLSIGFNVSATFALFVGIFLAYLSARWYVRKRASQQPAIIAVPVQKKRQERKPAPAAVEEGRIPYPVMHRLDATIPPTLNNSGKGHGSRQ